MQLPYRLIGNLPHNQYGGQNVDISQLEAFNG